MFWHTVTLTKTCSWLCIKFVKILLASVCTMTEWERARKSFAVGYSLKDVKHVLSHLLRSHLFIYHSHTDKPTHSPPHYLVSHRDVSLLDQYCVSLTKISEIWNGGELWLLKCVLSWFLIKLSTHFFPSGEKNPDITNKIHMWLF